MLVRVRGKQIKIKKTIHDNLEICDELECTATHSINTGKPETYVKIKGLEISHIQSYELEVEQRYLQRYRKLFEQKEMLYVTEILLLLSIFKVKIDNFKIMYGGLVCLGYVRKNSSTKI